MNYRELLDIPKIDWVPFDVRFGSGDYVPPNESGIKRGRGRPRVEPKPVAHLTHRDIGCAGKWKKIGKNKSGQPRIFCTKCHATRIVKYDA